MTTGYYAPPGGLPPQSALMTQRAIFTEAYAFIPKGCFSDIVTSSLPGWDQTRLWLIARPMTGFAETFSQYVMEVAPGGGSDAPDPDTGAEHWLFFTGGLATLTIDGTGHEMDAGGYAFIPAGHRWTLHAEGSSPTRFHWLRKLYEPAPGLALPDPILINERDVPVAPMPDTGGVWGTTRFADPADLRHDALGRELVFGEVQRRETPKQRGARQRARALIAELILCKNKRREVRAAIARCER